MSKTTYKCVIMFLTLVLVASSWCIDQSFQVQDALKVQVTTYSEELKSVVKALEVLELKNKELKAQLDKGGGKPVEGGNSVEVEKTSFEKISELGEEVHTFSITSYSPEECKNKHTATGTTPTAGRTVAVSRDYFEKWKGRQVYVEGYGVFTVEDSTAHSINGKRIKKTLDIFSKSSKVARNIGRKKLKVVLLKDEYTSLFRKV